MKDLIGRSRNERKLDGIYNKQRGLLIKRIKTPEEKDLRATLSKRKLNETVPFPEIYKRGKRVQANQKEKRSTERNEEIVKTDKNEQDSEQENGQDNIQKDRNKNGIDLYKGIKVIIYKHIYSKNKFFKSVNIFIRLCLHYMTNENKQTFFFAFDKILNVFSELYLNNEMQKSNSLYTFYKYDELHIKCIISLFDKVINRIVENRFVIKAREEEEEEGSEKGDEKEEREQKTEQKKEQKEKKEKQNKTVELTRLEKNFLKMLKIKVYYLIVLFKLNDNFIFNKLIVIYKNILEEIQRDYSTHETMEKEEKTNEKEKDNVQVVEGENAVTYGVMKRNEDDQEKNGDEEDDEEKDDQEKNGDEEDDEEKDDQEKNGDEEEDNNKLSADVLSHFDENWKIPTNYQIYKMKKKAFVRCMSYLIHFRKIPWAKVSVEMLFQEIYRKKYMFDTCDEIIIENIQSSIKSNSSKNKSKVDSVHVLSIGETLNPVVDARDEKIVSLHGSHIWSNKQIDH